MHGHQCGFDVGQRGQVAQVDRVKLGTTNGIDHHPTDQIVEDQVCVDFFDGTGWRMRTKILNVEAMLPLAIDGLDLPATMIEVNQFAV